MSSGFSKVDGALWDLRDLMDHASFVIQCAEDAKRDLDRGDFKQAIDRLQPAKRAAGMVEMKLRWALEKIEAAQGGVAP